LGQHHEAGQFWLARAFELLEVVFDEHRVSSRARSARKFMKTTASPSSTFTGSPMEVALTNSSLSPRA
jgi:hypothetical protein